MDTVFAVSIGVGLVSLLVLIVLYYLKRPETEEVIQDSSELSNKPAQPKHTRANKGSKSKGKFQPFKKRNVLQPHPHLAANFKGHTDTVLSLSFDPNGKYLASSSKDYTVRVWLMKTVDHKEKKSGTHHLSYDHAEQVAFSSDGVTVLGTISYDDSLQVLKVSRSGNSVSLKETLRFKLNSGHMKRGAYQRVRNVSLDIASNGLYIMVCFEDCFSLWTTKAGDNMLAKVTTNLSPNTCAVISPCSKFIACSGFTTSAKIYEVEYSSSGEFKQVSSVMSLNGHSASIVSLQFSTDSKRVVTVSKDKTCRIWDIDVRYQMKEETRCLNVISLDSSHPPSHVALSPDGLVVAVTINTSVWLYSPTSGNPLHTLNDIHNDSITAIVWESSSLYFATAGGDDRYIRVWHNVAGMTEQLAINERDLKNAKSQTLKDRLEKDILRIKERLAKINEKSE